MYDLHARKNPAINLVKIVFLFRPITNLTSPEIFLLGTKPLFLNYNNNNRIINFYTFLKQLNYK
jgi:hypothetical protein